MSTLYQPVSRSIMQRNMSGCLTPSNNGENGTSSSSSAAAGEHRGKETFVADTIKDASTILSPPLSPYSRSHAVEARAEKEHNKCYMDIELTFKLEDFRAYELKLNAWSNLGSNYKRRQLDFLEQYSIMSAKEQYHSERRPVTRRRHVAHSDSDSELSEKIRTRRQAKETPAPVSGAEGSTRQSTPPRKKPRKENHTGSPLALQQQSFIDENIPDFSPDVSTLPKGNNKCLKVEWKGQPMDLRSDPNVDKLHPAEVLLASILRLPCNVYLDSKRRLFNEKVKRLRSNMQFRRTDAQKACRIDVNKASRLFAAFEKVGWLNDSHFSRYL